MGSSRQKGNEAEKLVADKLVGDGYIILERNFYIRGGEIDIIVEKGSLIVFVEVRSWSRIMWENGSPIETIDRKKIRHIIRTANYYIQKHHLFDKEKDFRFDVAGVILADGDSASIEYIENAFDAEF